MGGTGGPRGRRGRRAIKNAFVVLSTNYSCLVVEEGFVTLGGKKRVNKKFPFATQLTGARPVQIALPAGSLFLVLLGYYRHLQ